MDDFYVKIGDESRFTKTSDATALALPGQSVGLPPTVDTTVIDDHNQHHYKDEIGMVSHHHIDAGLGRK